MHGPAMKPMKCEAATDEDVARLLKSLGVLWASPKIDGIRFRNQAVWLEREKRTSFSLVSASGKPFRNRELSEIFQLEQFKGYDGEIVVTEPNAPDACRATTAAINTINGSFDWNWYVFDNASNPDIPYMERYGKLRDHNHPRVHILPQTPIYTMSDFKRFEKRIVERSGYEGVILRDSKAPYKFGRVTLNQGWMVKIKRFVDGEAVVIGFEEMMSNQNEAFENELGLTSRSSAKSGMIPAGTLGALTCRDALTGKIISVGGGLSEAERLEIWQNKQNFIGRILTYKYFPKGEKDLPRHVGFKAWREAWDMTEVINSKVRDDVRDLFF